MVGRPIELDDLKAKRIVDAIACGLSRTAAARKGGISKTTLTSYLARGRDGEQPFAAFLARVQEAEVKAEEEMVACIRTAALDPKYWQAAKWWLETCRPADYASKQVARPDESERDESDEQSDLEVLESLVAAAKSRKVA